MNSRFEYVRAFEKDDRILLNAYFVVRIDGKAFHRFSDLHGFSKPNDRRSLDLMNRAAIQVMEEMSHIQMAFGQSDEYSFLFDKATTLYKRRESKIASQVVSLFSSAFTFHWKDYFDISLQYPPSFDARVVVYPTAQNVMDYFAWRQADTHINNLYNTVFWSLVHQGKMTRTKAHEKLVKTTSAEKNEILYQAGLNYNTVEPLYRKGSIIISHKWKGDDASSPSPHEGFHILHVDCISLQFWQERALLV